MTPGIECALSYKVDIESDENFEEIGIVHPRSVVYQDQYFGNGIKRNEWKNGKIIYPQVIQNITITNNTKIKNFYINNQSLICECDEQVEFV